MAFDPRLCFQAKSLLMRAIHGNDAPAIACKARGTPRNHAPLADKGEARSCDIPQRRPGTAPAGSPLVGLGQRDWNGVLTRNLGPSSIPFLDGVICSKAAWYTSTGAVRLIDARRIGHDRRHHGKHRRTSHRPDAWAMLRRRR